jgi:hypothetical protein
MAESAAELTIARAALSCALARGGDSEVFGALVAASRVMFDSNNHDFVVTLGDAPGSRSRARIPRWGILASR